MLYLITKESFGFLTIFDVLDYGRSGIGRNRDTIIDDPTIPDIDARLALRWDEERPLTPQHVAPFLGRPDDPGGNLFAAILADENISSVEDFLEYGYAIYEVLPGGTLSGDFDATDFDVPETVLGLTEMSEDGYLLTSASSLSELNDLQGLKIAVHGGFDDSVVSLLSAAGASSLRLPFGEVYQALQSGVIDAVLLPETVLLGAPFFAELNLDSFLASPAFFAGILAGSNSLLLTPTELPLGGDDGTGGTDDASSEYSGNQSSYTLTLSPTSNTITDRRADKNATTELTDISFLEFDSGTFDLSQFGGTTGLSEQDFESFIELYIAYFNRAPDAVGLNFWGTAFANGTTLEEMATLFVDQDETRATYPSRTTNEEFAECVYDNVFGRTPDQAGFEFWVDALDSNAVSRDQFILEVLRGVQPGSPDRSYLDAKVDIGTYFAVIRGMSDLEDAVTAMQLFDGTEDSISEAAAAIDDFYAEALDPNTGEFLMPLIGVLDDPFALT